MSLTKVLFLAVNKMGKVVKYQSRVFIDVKEVSISFFMNSKQICNSVTFYFMKNSFSDVSRERILPNMIRVGTALIIFGKSHFLSTSENGVQSGCPSQSRLTQSHPYLSRPNLQLNYSNGYHG